jgi:hypothetical protein
MYKHKSNMSNKANKQPVAIVVETKKGSLSLDSHQAAKNPVSSVSCERLEATIARLLLS